ncbi:hypothetical protein [Klebsiella pneumoniae]|uniref:hypothetical protein n=1 Tax=Klebsiella pneumoniae TaxID=573 RepID=UPI0040463DFB
MTKSTITRERLEQLANFKGAPVTRQEEQELARMALAAMGSEPVAYISKSDFDAGYPHILARRDFNKACTMPVYAAQPAPVVPELRVDWQENEFSAGWNACRAAMLQAGNSPAQSDCCPAQNVVVPAQSPIDHGYRPECECSGCKATSRICAELAGNPPVIPDDYVMVAASLLSELRDWAHPAIEEYCEMWAGRRDDEFPALRKIIADADALLAAAPQEVK